MEHGKREAGNTFTKQQLSQLLQLLGKNAAATMDLAASCIAVSYQSSSAWSYVYEQSDSVL